VQLFALRLTAAQAPGIAGPRNESLVAVLQRDRGSPIARADTVPQSTLRVFRSAPALATALTLTAKDDSGRHNSA
jgi:hypothetical protein